MKTFNQLVMPKRKNEERSKLGKILTERGLTLKEFAEMVFEKTGYFIAVTNLSNFATGYREIKKIEIATYFAETLEVDIKEIV
jgi:hypothetical protein